MNRYSISIPNLHLTHLRTPKLKLDDTQAPLLISVDANTYNFRFWTIGSYGSGDVDVTFIAGSWSLTDGTPSTSTGQFKVVDPTTINATYLDVAFFPTSGDVLDDDSITDSADEFSISGDAAGTAVLSSTMTPTRLAGDNNVFRYYFTGEFDGGELAINFAESTYDAIQTDSVGATTSISNLADSEAFLLLELTAELADPVADQVVDKDILNNRGFIDVPFTVPPYAADLDLESVTDLDPEFTVAVDSVGSLTLDESQPPQLVPESTTEGNIYTFRYWYTGTFTDGDLTLTFIGDSVTYLDLAGAPVSNFASIPVAVQEDQGDLFVEVSFGELTTLDTNTIDGDEVSSFDGTLTLVGPRGPPGVYRYDLTNAGDIALGDEITIDFSHTSGVGTWSYSGASAVVEPTRQITVNSGDSVTYIDVQFNTIGDVELDHSSIDGDEIALSGAGAGTASDAGLAPTRLDDSNVYRFYFTRGFVGGSVDVEFQAAAWTDQVGTVATSGSESITVIESLTDTEAQAEGGRVFFIDISGGLELNALGVLDEPLLEIRGAVSIELDFAGGRFSIDASGTVKLYKVGNIASGAARFILQTANTLSGDPEFWGVMKLQTNLDFLQEFGIIAEASVLLQLNTTPNLKTETIALEGVPGDTILDGLTVSTTDLPNALVCRGLHSRKSGSTSLHRMVRPMMSIPTSMGCRSMLIKIPATAIRLSTSKERSLRTSCPASAGRLLTAMDGSSSSKVDELANDGSLTVRSEFQTHELQPESFLLQLVGEFTVQGSEPRLMKV